MSGNIRNHYQSTAVTTSRPRHLIVMLHQGGVKYLNLAERHLADGEWEATSNCLIRAQNIVCEIALAFGEDEGDELVQGVRGVYGYMHRRLIEANTRKDSEALAEVRQMLREMSDAWAEAGQGMEDRDRDRGPFDASG